jgi:hypothetical protein
MTVVPRQLQVTQDLIEGHDLVLECFEHRGANTLDELGSGWVARKVHAQGHDIDKVTDQLLDGEEVPAGDGGSDAQIGAAGVAM